MRHPIIRDGKIIGFITGNVTYTIEKDYLTKKKRIFGEIEECWIHTEHPQIYENIGEPESFFNIHILKDDGSEQIRLENLIINPPNFVFLAESILIVKNVKFASF
jgi:hypothetical protein